LEFRAFIIGVFMAAIVENDDSNKKNVSAKHVLLVSILFAISFAYAMQGLVDISRGEVSGGIAECILFVAPACIPGYFLMKRSVVAFISAVFLGAGWLVGLEFLLQAFS
jgi:hypothetical protein